MMKENIGGLMSRVYNSLKLKIQDTLQWGKINSMPLARVKSTNALNLNHEMEGLERVVADRIGKLKAAVKAGEAMVEEARQAEQLVGNLKADITALEAKLKEREETIQRKDSSRQALESELKEKEKLARQKDSTIKELEQKLAAKVQEFESMVKDKQDLLTRRDAEINDLKSQLKRLTKGISEMSSFFRQAEALAGIEGQDVRTAAQNEPVDEVEEKPVAVQSNIARVTPIVVDAAGEMVSPEIFQRIINELAQVTNVMAPLASLLVHQQAKALGESVEKFPRTRLPELLEGLVKEISDENRQDFRQRLAQSAQITLN
jgi:DNA repair exonuclease SbcCD ATPase subunit